MNSTSPVRAFGVMLGIALFVAASLFIFVAAERPPSGPL